MYKTRLSPCSNKSIIDPGQWPAGTAVTDSFLSEHSPVSFGTLLIVIGVASTKYIILALIFGQNDGFERKFHECQFTA